MVKFKDYVTKRLNDLNIEHVFGLPGSYIMPIWETVGEQIQIVLAKHEGNAVYMAEGWARASGKIGVILTTIGPGVSNSITGIASSHKDSVPLLVISGQAATQQLGTGVFQDSSGVDRSFNSIELTRPVTKGSFEILSRETAINTFEQALSLATNARNGPVHLSIPLDIQNAEVPVPKKLTNIIEFLNSNDMGIINTKIKEAIRPLIIIGGGCKESENLNDFIEDNNIPTISTIKGQTFIGINNKWFVGSFGTGSLFDLSAFLEEYPPDLILVLGASMSSYYMQPMKKHIENAYVIQIDIEYTQIGFYNFGEVDLGVLSTVQNFINYWQKKDINYENSKLCEEIVIKYKKIVSDSQRKMSEKSMRANIIYKLNKLLSTDILVVPDAGNHWLDTISLYKPREPFCFLANTGLGGMGYAIGASIGYQLANIKRRVVCITGDGSFLMTGTEFSTAIQYNVPVIFVLFNDASLGRVYTAQKMNYNSRFVSSDLPEISYSKLAKSMGANAYTVMDIIDFEESMKMAMKYVEGPTLIEVLISKDQDPVFLIEE